MDQIIKPRFEIHKIEGKRMRPVVTSKVKLDKKGEPVLNKEGNKILLGGFDHTEIEVDAGWDVYFPCGSHVHIWTQEEMERQGFLQNPTLVNMETGDEVGPMADTSFKARAEQVANRGKSSRVAQT
jgi:hypothetical protein